MNKNWFGKNFHETDEYIHWADKNPEETANKLRLAWDKLVAIDKDSLKTLLDVAYKAGARDEADNNDPDL